MSETDLIIKKNDSLRRKNVVIILQQILLFLALSGYVFILFLTRLTPPAPEPTIDVLRREVIACADGEMAQVCVPDEIVVGKPFEYRVKGTKLVDNSASVSFQTVCNIGNNEDIRNIGSIPYSSVPKGPFDLTRSRTIPDTVNVQSDDCYMQSIALYTFYQNDDGIERPIEIKEVGTSNRFKLRQPVEPSVEAPEQSPSVSFIAPDQPSTSMSTTPTTSGGGDNPRDNVVATPVEPSPGLIQRLGGTVNDTARKLLLGE